MVLDTTKRVDMNRKNKNDQIASPYTMLTYNRLLVRYLTRETYSVLIKLNNMYEEQKKGRTNGWYVCMNNSETRDIIIGRKPA